MFQSFKGYRTYILVGVALLVWVGQQLGYIAPDIATKVVELLGISSIGTLRAAIPPTTPV